MSYFNMEINIDQHVNVELDTDEVLSNMDQSDILDYVSANISVEEVLDGMDRDEVNDFVLSRMNYDTLRSEVLKNYSISTLLRAIADKLDSQ